jgi:hypothetical protein
MAMPNFDAESLLRWFHFVGLVLAGGSMPVCLMLSGFEDTHEDVRGLSAVIWQKITLWGMRCAVCFGFLLFILSLFKGNKPFAQPHLMFKIGMGPILLFLCETAPKPLSVGKRGLALIATVLFLVTSFIAANGRAFSQIKPNTSLDTVSADPSVAQ